MILRADVSFELMKAHEDRVQTFELGRTFWINAELAVDVHLVEPRSQRKKLIIWA